jgi:hypothetical protein
MSVNLINKKKDTLISSSKHYKSKRYKSKRYKSKRYKTKY